jgi:hypothetical protein
MPTSDKERELEELLNRLRPAFRVGRSVFYLIKAHHTGTRLHEQPFKSVEAAQIQAERLGIPTYDEIPGRYVMYTRMTMPTVEELAKDLN